MSEGLNSFVMDVAYFLELAMLGKKYCFCEACGSVLKQLVFHHKVTFMHYFTERGQKST